MGFFAGVCLIAACVAGLAIVLPLWLASLLMGVVLAGDVGGAYVIGRLAFEELDPLPQRTLETLRENMDWAKVRSR